MKDENQNPDKNTKKDEEFPGYPIYPANEDIYRQEKEEIDIDPENPSQRKKAVTDDSVDRRISKDQEMDGEDLDVPGSELDDELEEIGSEDEENNYYSLGGDNHNELEESAD
jgi:hypothetical protein